MNRLAQLLANTLSQYSVSSVNVDEVRYGIEIVLGAMVQILLVAIAAIIVGVCGETMLALLTAFVYRRYTGGIHCEKYYRCTITTIINFLLLGIIAIHIPIQYQWLYIVIVSCTSILLIKLAVPVDNPILVISDPLQRKIMKVGAFYVFIVMLVISTGLILLEKQSLGIAILLGLLWQDITLIKPGKIYINAWDRFFENLEQLVERR